MNNNIGDIFMKIKVGKVIDLFINYLKVKEKDENYFFVQEIKRLYESIQMQIQLSMR